MMRSPENVISLAELSGSVWRVAAATLAISEGVPEGAAAVSAGTRCVVFGAAFFFTAARFFCFGRCTLTGGSDCGSAEDGAADCAHALEKIAAV
jgi:hypothetical protein